MKQVSTHNEGRILYLDVLRILATFAVIALHVYATQYKTSFGYREWYYALTGNALVRWAVPMFLMISGTLFLRPTIKLDYSKLLKKYILRLTIAYIFWVIFYHLYFIAISQEAPTPFIHLWFVPMLIGVYLFIPVLKKIAEDRSLLKSILLIWFLLFSVGKVIGLDKIPQVGTIFRGSSIIIYSGYFLLGYYIDGIVTTKKQRQIIYILGCLGAISSIGTNAYFSFKNGHGDITIMDNNCAPHVVLMAVAIFIAVKQVSSKYTKHLPKITEYLQKDLFGIYLTHMIWHSLFNHPSIRNCTSQLITLPLITIAVFVFSLYTTKIIRKIPLLKKVVE